MFSMVLISRVEISFEDGTLVAVYLRIPIATNVNMVDKSNMREATNNPLSAIRQRQAELRRELWPEVSDDRLWLRKVSNGFTTVPRTLPLIFGIMDAMSKGRPVSATYLDIWCRSFDDCFIALNRPLEMAFSAGFSGQRAEQTWIARVKSLADLGFINLKSGPFGPLSYALILNPYKVVKTHRNRRTEGFPDDLYHALLARAAEIGATDLAEPVKEEKEPNGGGSQPAAHRRSQMGSKILSERAGSLVASRRR